MRQLLAKVVIIVGCVFICSNVVLAAWVESKNQGMQIRHPQGWKVDWIEQGVGVFHPQDPMIWSVVRSEQFQGRSRQLAEEVVKGAASQVGEVRPLIQKQVSQRPDLYGIKFSGQRKGIPFTALVLVVTEDGHNFVVRQYSAPTKVYDEMKLTLVPILCSFCGQGGGGTDGASASGGKGWQHIQSPRGIWRFTAPAGWMLNPGEEGTEASVVSPNAEVVFVKTGMGSGDYLWLMDHRLTPPVQNFPLLPATELLSRFILPYGAALNGFHDVKIVELKSMRPDLARFTVSFSDRAGHKLIEEGFVKNNSFPHQGGDANLYTMWLVGAPADRFPSRKDELWRIVSTFESSPQFGSFWVQGLMKLRRDNQQALTNMVLQTMQSNKQIMQQHVAIAQQRPGQMAQQGQGWINAVTGQEVVRDPQSGQRWQVPVGGQYIYGRNTGEVIRADRPLQMQELPEGFRQFEGVK